MLTMEALAKMRVYRPRKQSRRDEKKGIERDPKRLGKVHSLVFSPDGRRVVGLMVKLPDIVGMVKQDDRFLALDSFDLHEGGLLITRDKESFDALAAKRLGVDLDRCIIWGGCDVRCESGKPLGYVLDARFDEVTGAVDCFCAQEGSAATAIVGTFEIPAAWVVRYDAGCMVVRDEAASLEPTGGLAAKAGEGYANAKEGAKRAAAKADAAAAAAVDKGSHGLGRLIGKAKAGAKQVTSDFVQVSGVGDGKPASGMSRVGAPGSGTSGSGAPRSSESGSGAPRSSASRAKKPSAKKPADAGEKAARAVGEQLGKTRGMFSGFMREFKDASK